MNVEEKAEEREKLFPVVGAIIFVSMILIVASYVLGNLIYQIP
jgi:hypothetical protein|tara:strand:- start:713 stop:841 length:129 start_codon:yes stop_codon:yes gene_type:complete